MRVIFMGTPDFAVPALQALHRAGHEIVAVYSQPARAAGRGKKLRPTPVAAVAETLGLSLETPVNLRDADMQAVFSGYDADIAVVAAYGLILPQEVLDAPKMGCVNIHASLLPRWRGAAPIHRAIMAGDTETGITIMQVEAGLDAGPILLTGKVAIGADETTGELHDRLSILGADLILDALADPGGLVPVAQPQEGVNYAHKIDKAEARIDWNSTAKEITRQINGLSPFPGAWTQWNSDRLKCLRAVVADGAGAPGQVLDDHLTVACSDGAVSLLTLQKAGKSAMDAEVFLRGEPIPPGAVLI